MEKPTNKNISNPKKLSILIARDGLSFCISAKGTGQVSFFFEKNLQTAQSPEQLLEYLRAILKKELSGILEEVSEIEVLYQNALYALVPAIYFSEDHLTDYLKYNIKTLPTDLAAYDVIPTANLKNVYLPFMNINNFLFENFGEFTYRHTCSVLIEKTLEESVNSEEKVHINIQGKQINICIVKNSSLLLCNSFEYETATDFVYYVLFCLEQLKLDPDQVHLYLSGKIDKKSSLYTLLYTYVRTITFAEPQKETIKFTENLKQEASHKNYILLSSLSCG